MAQSKKGENKMTQNKPLVLPPILVPLPLKFPWKQSSEHSAACSKKAINSKVLSLVIDQSYSYFSDSVNIYSQHGRHIWLPRWVYMPTTVSIYGQ